MTEEFEKLFSTLSEKDQKEVAYLIRFKNEVKYHDKQFEELLNQYIELSRKYDKLQNNWNELKKWLKQIQDFHIEQRGLVDNEFNYSLESEDIDVLEDVLHKIQELE